MSMSDLNPTPESPSPKGRLVTCAGCGQPCDTAYAWVVSATSTTSVYTHREAECSDHERHLRRNITSGSCHYCAMSQEEPDGSS